MLNIDILKIENYKYIRQTVYKEMQVQMDKMYLGINFYGYIKHDASYRPLNPIFANLSKF